MTLLPWNFFPLDRFILTNYVVDFPNSTPVTPLRLYSRRVKNLTSVFEVIERRNKVQMKACDEAKKVIYNDETPNFLHFLPRKNFL